ncbi:sugar kinase [Nisaea acidiphila]|uniref:Sugar kinase n=1 Tax=Nisaea acidiphila TaxID=1862145 RepID=A0A9J7AWN7_9PROT|nr:sugar kinase [Nisaea acidiphila]UUX51712.1 sugar kinase [Nisaea acidiphila]
MIRFPDLLCLGEPMLEFNQQPDGRYLAGHGGDTSNAAIAAARQGASVGYLTRIGRDPFGESFQELWEREGVDTRGVETCADGHTGIYFVTHGADGHQFSYFRAGSAASRMTPGFLPRGMISAAKILHISGISQAISESAADTVFAAIAMAKDAGVKVSFDPNLRLKLWPLDRARAMIHAAMAEADIALPGLDDAILLTGLEDPDSIADFYLELGAGIVALTLGADGCLVATPDERRRVPGRKAAAKDATGAGDTYDGSFLAEYLGTGDPLKAAEYANCAAAIATEGFGAVEPMPDRATVEAALDKQ